MREYAHAFKDRSVTSGASEFDAMVSPKSPAKKLKIEIEA